jgi:hypothetical protein
MGPEQFTRAEAVSHLEMIWNTVFSDSLNNQMRAKMIGIFIRDIWCIAYKRLSKPVGYYVLILLAVARVKASAASSVNH